jgi:hypothetical protein
VHHPSDLAGVEVAQQVFKHFHGTAFSGLIGGATEVYVRADGWSDTTVAPRPILFPGDHPPNNLQPARLVVVVPVLSVPLARAVEDEEEWLLYVQRIRSAQITHPDRVGVFPLAVDHVNDGESQLEILFSPYQRIAVPSGLGDEEPSAELQCRDLCQGIAQMAAGSNARLQVFISHTRRTGAGEEKEVPELIRLVREIIGETRLRYFFDANDLQPGRDWDTELRQQAAHSALLALRTDLYASRAWCQREMLIAKRAGMPIVILDALGHGEERGSFLMDHIARIPVQEADGGWSKKDIRRGLNLLVDECLKRALWGLQQELATDRNELSIAWWAPHAPEPVTLVQWLEDQVTRGTPALGDQDLRILHPDPPLGPDEREALIQMVILMGHRAALDVMTPRGLASRGA